MNDFKSVQSSKNQTLRLSLLNPEQNQTSYLMENNHSESLGIRTKKRSKLKYVALETAGGMIGGSIAALGTYFYYMSKPPPDDLIGGIISSFEIADNIILSYLAGSLLGTHFTARVLKEKGSLIGALMGEFFIGGGICTVWGFILSWFPVDPYSNGMGALTLGIFTIGISIGGVIGYNYKTLL